MLSRAVRRGLVVAALLMVLGQSAAHHGPGLYDRTRTVTVTGTVTRFEFVNPHVLIYVVTSDAEGEERIWAGELTSPNRLARISEEVGWHADLLQPGDVVTLSGNPAKNGVTALLLNRVLDGDGNVLVGSGR